MTATAQLETPLQIWYAAIRPRSLTATYVPIALGGVIAYQEEAFNLPYFMLALLGTLALQIAANLFNEYFDFIKGTEAGKSHGLGLILKNGYLTPKQVLLGAIVSVSIGAAVGLFFVWQTGPLILWIGIAAVIVVVMYTASPFALAYIGLGEIAVFVFMGPLIVLGSYYVMAEDVTRAVWLGSLPIAFLVAAILHANNLRDLEADREGGKLTLAVRFGRGFARGEYLLLTLGGHMAALILVALGETPIGTLLVLLTLPETLRLCRVALTTEEVPRLHLVLVHTARLHKWFGVAFVGGWLLTTLLG